MTALIGKRSASTLTIMQFSSYPSAGGFLPFVNVPVQEITFHTPASIDIAPQAFSPGNEIHFYYIQIGAPFLVATLDSPAVVGSGSLTVSGNSYPQWAYLSSVILDGSGNLPDVYQAGNTVYHSAPSVILNAGTATTQTSVSVASKVPAVAESMLLQAIHHDSSNGTNTAIIRTFSGKNQFLSVCSANAYTTIDFTAPNIGQNFYYLLTAAGTLDVYAVGYTVPLL